MNAPREPDTFYIAPAYSDSTGHSAVPANAVFVGSRSAVMERILDSKARRAALTIINDAEHARGTIASIRKRERDVAAREDAVTAREEALLQQAIQKLDASADTFTQRIDTLEAERAHDPDDDDLPLPPGVPTEDRCTEDRNDIPSPSHDDDGHLQSPIPAPREAEMTNNK
jgi:cell division protein FtsB